MIVFVGDKPSNKNIDKSIPFVGTQSYKRLLDWIYQMDININDVHMKNKDDIIIHPHDVIPCFQFKSNTWITIAGCKFIALGVNASKTLNKLNIDHFKLPHPSPRNRLLNNTKWTNTQLEECKQWILNQK